MSHTIEVLQAECTLKTAELKEANDKIKKLETQLEDEKKWHARANERAQIALDNSNKLEAQLKNKNDFLAAANERCQIAINDLDKLEAQLKERNLKKLQDQLPTLDPQGHIIPPVTEPGGRWEARKYIPATTEQKLAFMTSQVERLRGVLKEKSKTINDLNHDYAEISRAYRADQSNYHRLMISCTQLRDFADEHFEFSP